MPPRLPPFTPLRRRHARPGLLCLNLLAIGCLGCQPASPPRAAKPEPQAEGQQPTLALRQCQQQRRALLQGLADLRRAEAILAERREDRSAPLPPPPVWDEAAEQRFSEADQQLDRQRYEQDFAAWQRRRADHQALVAEQRQRREEAQQQLDRQAQGLRQRHPALFTAPTSIEVRQPELERLSRCPSTQG